jgi:hypothetical protein
LLRAQPLVDASKLKKHIQLLCDRLAKGVKLTRLPDKKKKGPYPPPIPMSSTVALWLGSQRCAHIADRYIR